MDRMSRTGGTTLPQGTTTACRTTTSETALTPPPCTRRTRAITPTSRPSTTARCCSWTRCPEQLRLALGGVVRLCLHHVSIPLASLAMLLSSMPRLRSFASDHCQHVSATVLLLLARSCPEMVRISLENATSAVLHVRQSWREEAQRSLEQLQLSAPVLPSPAFPALRALILQLPGYDKDVDAAGFASLVQLLNDSPLQWLSFRTVAALPASSLQQLSRLRHLRGLHLSYSMRPAAAKLLQGRRFLSMYDLEGGGWYPSPRPLYTEKVRAADCDFLFEGEPLPCTTRFQSSDARLHFFSALAALPAADERPAFLRKRVRDVCRWIKTDGAGTMLRELPRERRWRLTRRQHLFAHEAEDSEED